MSLQMIVPQYAKDEAAKALVARNAFAKKPGLEREAAARLGINSGVERAKQIIASTYLEEPDLRSMARFYARFRNYRTPRAEVAIMLWGGRRFLEEVCEHVQAKR